MNNLEKSLDNEEKGLMEREKQQRNDDKHPALPKILIHQPRSSSQNPNPLAHHRLFQKPQPKNPPRALSSFHDPSPTTHPELFLKFQALPEIQSQSLILCSSQNPSDPSQATTLSSCGSSSGMSSVLCYGNISGMKMWRYNIPPSSTAGRPRDFMETLEVEKGGEKL